LHNQSDNFTGFDELQHNDIYTTIAFLRESKN